MFVQQKAGRITSIGIGTDSLSLKLYEKVEQI